MKTRIHLVRHGLSESNLDVSVNRRKPDHAIDLADEGRQQAAEAGHRMAMAIQASRAQAPSESSSGFVHSRVRLLISPYARTRQTAEGITGALDSAGIHYSTKEELAIREQSFGLFDGLSPEELKDMYPKEYAHYDKHSNFEGEFFAPMPMGESRARVSDRVRTCFGSILRDMSGRDSPPVTDMIIVSHGVTIRCFRLAFMHRPWEWCERKPNPANCSILTIEGETGRGWKEYQTFEGFPHPGHTLQKLREEGHVG